MVNCYGRNFFKVVCVIRSISGFVLGFLIE